MASTQGTAARARSSTAPVHGDVFAENAARDNAGEGPEVDPKTGKRRFWPFGKKREEKSSRERATTDSAAARTSPVPGRMHGAASPTSPGRLPVSPSSSQIFERNVQEEGLIAGTPQSAIPSHITTENHIPPVLDASSMAITDDHLTPDNVEIVTHVAHQPAAMNMASGIAAASDALSQTFSFDDGPATLPHGEAEDGASSYGALDSADVRRLSFISFADVVHAEQAHAAADTASHAPSISSPHIGPVGGGSSSPAHTHGSPRLAAAAATLTSPGLVAAGLLPAALPASPPRMVGVSPSPPQGVVGELAIETMTQALRRTKSGDLSGHRDFREGSGDGAGSWLRQ